MRLHLNPGLLISFLTGKHQPTHTKKLADLCKVGTVNRIWREQNSWHKIPVCSVQPLLGQGRCVALFHIALFQLYEVHQDDTSMALTWFRTETHTCSSKYKQICNLSYLQSLEGNQVKAGAGACLQPDPGLTKAQGRRKRHARQDVWHCNLVVTVTFYLTRQIVIISFMILIVILKCA